MKRIVTLNVNKRVSLSFQLTTHIIQAIRKRPTAWLNSGRNVPSGLAYADTTPNASSGVSVLSFVKIRELRTREIKGTVSQIKSPIGSELPMPV